MAELIKKCEIHRHVYILEYYSSVKMKPITPFATIWMVMDHIHVRKIIQTQQSKFCMISAIRRV